MKKYFQKLTINYSFIFLLKASFALTICLIILDYINLPTQYIIDIDKRLLITIAIAFIFIIVIMSIELSVFHAFKIYSINFIDMSLLVIVFSTLLYVLAAIILDIFSIYKQLILLGMVIITACYLLNRIIMFNKQQSLHTEGYDTNVIDLKDIYENTFEISSNLPILIEEKDVDYDLLKRGKTIDLLYNSILTCNPTKSFVISLEESVKYLV